MPTEQRKVYDLDRVVRTVFSALLVGAGIWLIDYLSGVILPFLLAFVLAYLFEPFVLFNKRLLKAKKRVGPVILTLFEVLLFNALLLYFLIPYLYAEVAEMVGILEQYTREKWIIPYLSSDLNAYIRDYINIEYISSLLTQQQWVTLVTETLESMMSVFVMTADVISAIVSWVVVLLYMVFIMIDYNKLTRGFRSAVPRKYRHRSLRVVDDLKESMSHYFRGQALIAFIVGVLFAIGFTIIDLPLGIFMGMVIGVMNMVPYLQLVSIPITAILSVFGAVADGESVLTAWLLLAVVYITVQGIQDLFLTPKIMGKFMGLNPAIILLSLSVWGCLLGFIGLIIALPLTTLVMSYYKRFVLKYDERKAKPRRREHIEKV